MYKTILFLVIIGLFLTVLEFLLKDIDSGIDFMDRRYTNKLRGIAAVIVVISHVSGLTGTRVATPLGGIGVALFLICSGYGMYHSYSKRGLKGFWMGKIKRILLPYWITVALYYLINFREITFNATMVIRNLLLINPISFLWFVQFLMIFNLLFWLIFLLIPEKARLPVFWVISLAAILWVKNDMYAEQGFSFITGLMLAMYQGNKMDKNKALKIGSAFLAVSVLFLGIKQFPAVRVSFYMVMNIVQMCIKLFGACGILFIVWKIGAIWDKAFELVGKSSYEVYIVHTLFIPYLANSGVSTVTMLAYLVSCGIGVLLLHVMLQKLAV